MKKSSMTRSAVTLLLAAVCLTGASLQAASKNLLVVTVTKGFRHSSIPTAEAVLGSLAESSDEFDVAYARTDEEIAEKMNPEALKQWDGVIFANTTGDLPIPNREYFMEWIQSGKAFLGMHSASDTFHGFPKFVGMIGGEFLTHGRQVEVNARVEDRHHPSCQHYGEQFTVFDEIYILKNFHRDRVHGLLSQDQRPNTWEPGDYPIAWCSEYGKGKVFYTSLGHREDIWTSDHYQKHILGGIRWALGLAEGDGSPINNRYEVSPEERAEGFKPLFNGVNLDGWKLRHANGTKSWSVQNGMMVNNVAEGEHGTDIVTNDKYWNFTVRYEYLIPPGSNSGFYLRGRHEIQIFDDYGKKPEMGGNGAIYSVKPVSLMASRRAGEWQEVEATIKGNRITVTLNGVKVHDNVEVNKATGSELDANVDQPGSLFIQGDHGAIALRNIRIKVLD
ncbi:MAG: ThuA domain-containing protein [Verrucomicrobiota bacterium]|jgi:type 1 glutamine amidotransferase